MSTSLSQLFSTLSNLAIIGRSERAFAHFQQDKYKVLQSHSSYGGLVEPGKAQEALHWDLGPTLFHFMNLACVEVAKVD